MGTSTDGLLWYGLCWTHKDEKYYERGLPEPVAKRLELTNDEDHDYDNFEIVDKKLEPYDCELVVHCMGDYPMVGLAVKEASFSSSRGDPHPFEDTDLATLAEQGARLHQACEAIGWPYKEPKWWLASMWRG